MHLTNIAAGQLRMKRAKKKRQKRQSKQNNVVASTTSTSSAHADIKHGGGALLIDCDVKADAVCLDADPEVYTCAVLHGRNMHPQVISRGASDHEYSGTEEPALTEMACGASVLHPAPGNELGGTNVGGSQRLYLAKNTFLELYDNDAEVMLDHRQVASDPCQATARSATVVSQVADELQKQLCLAREERDALHVQLRATDRSAGEERACLMSQLREQNVIAANQQSTFVAEREQFQAAAEQQLSVLQACFQAQLQERDVAAAKAGADFESERELLRVVAAQERAKLQVQLHEKDKLAAEARAVFQSQLLDRDVTAAKQRSTFDAERDQFKAAAALELSVLQARLQTLLRERDVTAAKAGADLESERVQLRGVAAQERAALQARLQAQVHQREAAAAKSTSDYESKLVQLRANVGGSAPLPCNMGGSAPLPCNMGGSAPLPRHEQVRYVLKLLNSKGEQSAPQLRWYVAEGKGVTVKGFVFDTDVLREALRKWTLGRLALEGAVGAV